MGEKFRLGFNRDFGRKQISYGRHIRDSLRLNAILRRVSATCRDTFLPISLRREIGKRFAKETQENLSLPAILVWSSFTGYVMFNRVHDRFECKKNDRIGEMKICERYVVLLMLRPLVNRRHL